MVSTTGVAGTGISSDWVDPVVAALQDPSRRDYALSTVEAASAEGRITVQIEVILRSMLADTVGAMAAANRLREPLEQPFALDVFWIRELEPLRQQEDFSGLMAALGIMDYWESASCEMAGGQVTCLP